MLRRIVNRARMPSCEKCWKQSRGDILKYRQFVELSACTPEEQAGEEATTCPKCHRITMHQFAHVCMAC